LSVFPVFNSVIPGKWSDTVMWLKLQNSAVNISAWRLTVPAEIVLLFFWFLAVESDSFVLHHSQVTQLWYLVASSLWNSGGIVAGRLSIWTSGFSSFPQFLDLNATSQQAIWLSLHSVHGAFTLVA
jgi:hypothetical protein